MEIKSGRMTPKFEFEVTLRNPTTEKEFTTIPKQVIRITKAYPEFNKNAEANQEIKSNLSEKRNKANELTDSDVKKIPEKKVIKKENENQNTSKEAKSSNSSAQAEAQAQEKILESEFKKEDLEDPNNLDNMMSLKVMEVNIAKMDAEIKKIEGRPPSKLRQKFIGMRCRYNTMKSQIEEGDITLQNYINILENQIVKDKRIANYFKQEGDKVKLMILVDRIKLMMKELEEGKAHLK